MSYKKTISILGVTGSIGQSTMDVILSAPECFDVRCVTAHKNVSGLALAAIKLNAKYAIIADEMLERGLVEALDGTDIIAQSGGQKIEEAASQKLDIIMAAIMGFAGLRPIIAALKRGTRVAVANKEPLVAAGPLIMALAREHNAKILPVDSEHNAIFQVFEQSNRAAIDKIILTASGGPFLNWTKDEMASATPDQAIKHPNWSMGQKISVDSATMMNKALEIIEAHYLFDMPADKIKVLIHPQSTIHSMVSYIDGSILSQMGASDMRTPIASALAWPKRMESAGDKLDLDKLTELSFSQPDFDKFPALSYAYKCIDMGPSACIMMNAANEIAVDAFLSHRISFGDIMHYVSYSIDFLFDEFPPNNLKTVEEIERLDHTTRKHITQYIARRCAA